MDLSYPPAIQASLDRFSQALAAISVKDELEACERKPELWGSPRSVASPASGPLAQVAEFRALGSYALPLPELLAKSDRAYVPLPADAAPDGSALGWPDASAPWTWLYEDPSTVQLSDGKLRGSVSVAPFCIPAGALAFLAEDGAKEHEFALVQVASNSGRAEQVGDAFAVQFENVPARVFATGQTAIEAWEQAVLWERLALLGLTLGLMDRCWRISLDALCEGKRAGSLLADEQVAQFQLADNDIERLSAQNLILDAAVDVENGKASAKDKLALVRYFTSGQAERCAARALHVAQLFTPRMVPIARWFVQRAHHLATFNAAREYEVRSASNGVIAGLSLE
jgi:Acyl-CoA dehydrogenase, C-terminal domain